MPGPAAGAPAGWRARPPPGPRPVQSCLPPSVACPSTGRPQRELLVERDVEGEDVHPGLAEEAEVAALDEPADQGPDRSRAGVPRRGDPVHLQVGVLRGDERVQARPGRGHRVRRDAGHLHVVERGVGLLPLLDQLHQRRVVRAQVGRGGVAGVAAVVGLGAAGRVGGPGLEVLHQRVALGVHELLAQQAGADHVALVADQGAVGLVVEGPLGHPEHDQRIENAGDHGEEQQAAQRSEMLPDEARKTIHDWLNRRILECS